MHFGLGWQLQAHGDAHNGKTKELLHTRTRTRTRHAHPVAVPLACTPSADVLHGCAGLQAHTLWIKGLSTFTLCPLLVPQVLTFFTDVLVCKPTLQPGTPAMRGQPPLVLRHARDPLPQQKQQQQQQQADQPHLSAAVAAAAADDAVAGAAGTAGAALPAPTPCATAAAAPQTASPPQEQRAVVVVMEYCDGGTLAEAADRGVFSSGLPVAGLAGAPKWLHIYQTLLEVAAALRYLHSLGLVHRDVKMQVCLISVKSREWMLYFD